MVEFLKKQSIGWYLTLAAFALNLLAFIFYGVNVSSSGYFYGSSVPAIVWYASFELVELLAILVLAQVRLHGTAGRVLTFIKGAMQIVAAILPALALVTFIEARVEGLGFIYFSNEEILATIQTAENIFSATTAIVGFVLFGLTWLLACVAAFFRVQKWEEPSLTEGERAETTA